jgi:hypothetical protein
MIAVPAKNGVALPCPSPHSLGRGENRCRVRDSPRSFVFDPSDFPAVPFSLRPSVPLRQQEEGNDDI